MYRIRSADGTSALFQRCTLQELKIQQALREISRGNGCVTCLCKGNPGAPLHVRERDGRCFVARPPGDADQHLHGCLHAQGGDLAATFGFDPNIVAEVNGRIEIYLRGLFETPKLPGDSGEEGGSSRRGNALLSLLWLLIIRARLNVYHASQEPKNAWDELQFAASSIVAVGAQGPIPLSNMLLLPNDRSSNPEENNIQKLRFALAHKAKILFAALLPDKPKLKKGGTGYINLMPGWNPAARIQERDMMSHLLQFEEAFKHWQKGGNVLTLAIGSAAAPKHDGQFKLEERAFLERMAFLPVNSFLVPMPTPALMMEFERCKRQGDVFAVCPEHDPNLGIGRGP